MSVPRENGHSCALSTSRNGHAPLYRLNSNQSSTSIFEEVEMAHDELFSGPIAESLPTSVSAFSHRRPRADSTTSFAYYQDEPEPSPTSFDDERRSMSDVGDFTFGDEDESDVDIENGDVVNDYMIQHRRSSTHSRSSVHARLLRRDSATTNKSMGGDRLSQKIYMVNEDLTIAIAGFRTSRLGFAAYAALCLSTLGLAWLLLRWLPRWQVRLLGKPFPLAECDWVVVENQWGEFVVMDVDKKLYGRPMSTIFGSSEKSYAMDDEYDPIITELRMLNYRYVRLYFNQQKDKFVMFNGWVDPNWTDPRVVRAGIDSDEKGLREVVFGNNLIDIEQKSIPQLLVDEVFHPFYVFQIASLVLWSLDEYYYYAIAIFLMSFGSITTTLIETRATMKRLREISRFECDVRVLRNGFWRYVPSSELVPGDVYEVSDPNLTQFPSDGLLLSGDCIVNESMLTGESVPVSKTPATDETLYNLDLAAPTVSPEIAKHFLFCGTKIIRARRPQEDRDGDAVALALVVRTGFSTTKGSLVRSMLFPKPSGFKFYRDSFRYISVMAVVAMLGFIASFVNFLRLHLAWHLIIVRALDLITIVVPPALPATLTIGTNFALSRLKKKQIFCISPQRVNVGGKLDIMCFDKTGTLTEDGLDIFGVRVASPTTGKFTNVLTDPSSLVLDQAGDSASKLKAALFTMATCHSLRSVDDELMGDPLDLKMFEFTRWSFEEGKQGPNEADDQDQGSLSPSVARPPAEYSDMLRGTTARRDQSASFELGVLRSFEFVSQLRRASVIVRQFGQQSGDIYVKGAPECMREICREDSFPIDYDEQLAYYTHKGYRVIGCATRHIPKLSWVKAQKMKRHEAESNLEFTGFIIFENKLKPTTASVLTELLESNISTTMVTGDNILTAISVARECNLINKTAHCFVPRFIEVGNAGDPKAQLQWESIDNGAFHLNAETLLPSPPPADVDASLAYNINDIRNYSLAVSGDVFRWIVDFASPLVLQRMLVRGRVFARMSPDEKHELVEKLQSIGYCCGFCGDGANDCGALKAADVGISLSEAEASVAAPFTSRVFDIGCVPQVIREGRAALVTSFSCFKYMSLYSAIQFTSVSFLYATASNLGDFQFLFIDLLLILPIAVFMSWAGPFPVLSRKRPTADLVSRKVLIPLLGQMAICILIQAVAYVAVREQPWYIPPRVNHDKSNIKNSENTVLFLVSCFEYILAGVVLNAGPPFREKAVKNWPFMATIAATLLITLYMIVGPAHSVRHLMQLTKTSWDFEVFMIILGGVYFAAAWTSEKYIFQKLARAAGYFKERVLNRPKQRKEYKIILENMQV
ncbi:putative CDP-alcohol phosphatidyltransferase class-I family protein [Colletotrichum spaethianum]|uniref:Cation-transporting ATPase n=1 Tax=Colletotrichum spaethianum TaxID=700344 RepID=A0AA37PDM3_9PEZI|nr:putative CDP-alcohol phosphatidyltransferase class-I family protein [Colletotrichum spaethianum]GKT50259.1 putative CDP-alcohol phosphatidyltransferase class-I family protein [Colletotrichum spaethianum]